MGVYISLNLRWYFRKRRLEIDLFHFIFYPFLQCVNQNGVA